MFVDAWQKMFQQIREVQKLVVHLGVDAELVLGGIKASSIKVVVA